MPIFRSATKRLQAVTAFFLVIVFVSACSSLPREILHEPQEPFSPVSNSSQTEMTRSVKLPSIAAEQSAVYLQESGWEALAQRLALVELAERFIEIQYYIWNSDVSGSYLTSRLVAAADRGVQVRVMLDDVNLDERENLLAALDKHPNIEIRIFNPFPSRRGLAKWIGFLGDFSRYNRRMHNKSFTVDGVFSIIGGRNIGDEYFDLSDELNFRDRDVLIAGAVVPQITNSFAQFWNSRWSYPVKLLSDTPDKKIPELGTIAAPVYDHQEALPISRIDARNYLNTIARQMKQVQARFVYDIPVPADPENTDVFKATANLIAELSNQANHEILIESAYLIYDDRQLKDLQQQSGRGIIVRSLTNSMASNDVLGNHSGYARRRLDMLDSGMQIFELKPNAALCHDTIPDPKRCAPDSHYGLHSKSVVFDRHIAAIGSFNLNLRSTYLNTELMLVIEDSTIATKVAASIEHAMQAENSWELQFRDGRLHWISNNEDWTNEPETGQWERIKSKFIQLLPVEKYL